MDPIQIMDLAMDVGYHLAKAGAETYRVEESINRIIGAYGYLSDVFVIPNCMHVTILREGEEPITRMRRIRDHGNDLDAVERYSNISRRICAERPAPTQAEEWMRAEKAAKRVYPLPALLLANFLGAAGFAILFGGGWIEMAVCGVCGVLVGLTGMLTTRSLGSYTFFHIVSSALVMAFAAYAASALLPALNYDAVISGASMLLVPGLLFTNAMRDIIYGDTNSGWNRVVQVLLIAAAIAIGTALAHGICIRLFGTAASAAGIDNSYLAQAAACFVAVYGFSMLFNIHGRGILLCCVGGTVTWLIFLLAADASGSELSAYFFSSLFAALYAEAMARVRKYPAISYLTVSIFPLLPGAGVYYTMKCAVEGDLDGFAAQGMHTAAIAGIIAVAVIFGSTAGAAIFGSLSKRLQK